jgi:hypothetical protein
MQRRIGGSVVALALEQKKQGKTKMGATGLEPVTSSV